MPTEDAVPVRSGRRRRVDRRSAAALLLSLAIPVTAPFLGTVRDLFLDRLGEGALAVGMAAAGIAALLLAVLLAARLRQPLRAGGLARWGALAAALAMVVAQLLAWRSGDRRVDLVERVHLAEYGLLAMTWYWALRPRHRPPALPLLAVLAAGLVGVGDEMTQWASAARLGDVRDVLLNLWAAGIGVLAAIGLLPPAGQEAAGKRPRPLPADRSARLALRLAAVAVLAVGGFVACAHLGHRVEDPVTGSFLSYHSAEELARARDERSRRWAEDPPPAPAPLVLEDYFLTEAGAHALARNTAWEAGDMAAAWRENLILERWYTPFLDTTSFAHGVRHRWPPVQRRHAADAAAVAGAPAPRGAVGSRVFEDRIVTPSRGLYWSAVALIAGGLWLSSYRVGRRLVR